MSDSEKPDDVGLLSSPVRWTENGHQVRPTFRLDNGAYVLFEDLPVEVRVDRANLLSGPALVVECEILTEKSKSLARVERYENARRTASAADFLEAYLSRGGYKHR